MSLTHRKYLLLADRQMEEIRIWRLSGDHSEKAKAIRVDTIAETTTEQLLEDVLTGSPDVLMPNLRLIGRQMETQGGPLDLLGVDEDGRIVVFELKRGNLTRDAVAQAIDYASFLDSLEIDALCRHLATTSGKGGTEQIPDFAQWYQTNFQRPVSEIGRPRIVLVGLGVDERAKRMVAFLAQAELDISLLTFHGFSHAGETLLARQVEVKAREATVSVKNTKRANQAKLDQLLSDLGLKNEYESVSSVLRQGLGDSAYQWPNPAGYSYYLQEISETGGPTNRAYLAIYPSIYPSEGRGKIFKLSFQGRAVQAVGESELHKFAASLGAMATIRQSGSAEFSIDAQTPLATYSQPIQHLGQAIVAGWKKKMEALAKAEAKADDAEGKN